MKKGRGSESGRGKGRTEREKKKKGINKRKAQMETYCYLIERFTFNEMAAKASAPMMETSI